MIKGLEDLEIRRWEATIQTTALLRSVRILRKVLESWDLLSLKLQWNTINAGVENSQRSKIMIIAKGGGSKGAGRAGNWRMNHDYYPNYSPGDLKRLAVIQTPVKNHQLTLTCKTLKEVYNNDNNNKTRHNWVGKVIHRELCKKFKFDHMNKWYMHNPESVLENEKYF